MDTLTYFLIVILAFAIGMLASNRFIDYAMKRRRSVALALLAPGIGGILVCIITYVLLRIFQGR